MVARPVWEVVQNHPVWDRVLVTVEGWRDEVLVLVLQVTLNEVQVLHELQNVMGQVTDDLVIAEFPDELEQVFSDQLQ